MAASSTHALNWRLMEAGDLASVIAMAAVIHTDFYEDDAVYLERMRLYGKGCFVLEGHNGELFGYAITHPWQLYTTPALNSLLGQIPDHPTTYYLHDIALMPASRGSGAAPRIVSILADQAKAEGLETMSLVSVNNSVGFWQKQGFEVVSRPELDAKLKSYSDDACFMVRKLI
ncbi:GNAT family N-acetyltransferase [Phyllobacterium sp. P30BS-XVII]|uniref:GNAT family N-acetyltransferase n=1 Tax=Phyllobacterium sp. P30BS-XVII TaxID=2587046 RepID=UPI000DDA765A|nr:GNAT family N-acetyltransferase [Phyllobacterium sp. P30BS-XVII]MBA8900204.1 ribosomal protein S18 acetylase RimI-like enzyme [Phyllobacterium sp. P30BS-XVII]